MAWLVALLALLALAAAPAGAETSLTATTGLGGYFRPGLPTPVAITLHNAGPGERLELRINERQPFRGKPVAPQYRVPQFWLSAGAERRYFVYPVTSRYGGTAATISLMRGEREINGAAGEAEPLSSLEHLLVAAGAGSDRLRGLTGQLLPRTAAEPVAYRGWRAAMIRSVPDEPPPPANLAPLTLRVGVVPGSDLPDRAVGFAAAAALYLNVPPDELSASQQRALQEWVTGGGVLILSAGPSWQRLREPFYADLLPASPEGSAVTQASPALAAFAGPPASLPPVLVARLPPLPGARVLLSGSAGLPLVVEARRGLGRVVLIAFDPCAAPVADWAGAGAFWLRLLSQVPAERPFLSSVLHGEDADATGLGRYSPGAPRTIALPSFTLPQVPAALSRADLPGFWVLAAFLLAYVLALGPVNYWFLQRRKCLELAWFTAPAIIVLFSLTAYVVGWRLHGGQLLLVRIAVVEATAGQRRGAQITYAGLFSPRRDSFRLRSGDPAVVLRGLSGAPSEESPPPLSTVVVADWSTVENIRLDMWEMGYARALGPVDLGGGFRLVKQQGGVPSVQNDTPFSLSDCALVYGDSVSRIGLLPGGASVSLAQVPQPPAGDLPLVSALPISLAEGIPTGTDYGRLKVALLQPFVRSMRRDDPLIPPATHPLLIGWADSAPTDLKVVNENPTVRDLTFFIVHLPRRELNR